MVDSQRIPIGISQCLLGSPVRFNGGHKQSRLCSDQLGECFEWVPFCPEVGIGLGTPREPIRLVGEPTSPRIVGSKTPGLDVTEALRDYAVKVATEQTQLCGFILMQKSPSCGMQRVKVYQANGHPAPATASGGFAAELMRQRPLLPVEEEGRLHDPVLRENFITRVMVYAAWQTLVADGLSARALLQFHARHKYLLLAHHPQSYQRMGHLLANLAGADLQQRAEHYVELLMTALKKTANRGSHSNVLAHIAGHFKRVLDTAERGELHSLIADYRHGLVPLVVPLTLLKHHLLKHPDDYLQQQAYLQPHPPALSLRNAI